MTSTTRLHLRLDASEKARIMRAADLRGVTLSAFVRDAALCEAAGLVAVEQPVILSLHESRRFLKALNDPFSPNEKLEKALAGHAWPCSVP